MATNILYKQAENIPGFRMSSKCDIKTLPSLLMFRERRILPKLELRSKFFSEKLDTNGQFLFLFRPKPIYWLSTNINVENIFEN